MVIPPSYITMLNEVLKDQGLSLLIIIGKKRELGSYDLFIHRGARHHSKYPLFLAQLKEFSLREMDLGLKAINNISHTIITEI